jgi:tetratricopeptide (TPR) repeat protein
MVGNFGEVQVMDWGLAKTFTPERPAPDSEITEADRPVGTQIHSLRDLESVTQAGSVLGTPAFMPPEQAGGEIDRIDSRSDVFGLGAILCVILTGKPPYSGKDSELVRLMAIRGDLSEALARLDACEAEPELVALAKRCLSAEPADRPAAAGEVAKAVAAFRAEAQERAKRAEIERARAEVAATEQRKRRKVQAALGLAFTALAALGGAFAWWVQRQQLLRQVEAEDLARVERERLARNAEAIATLLGQVETALQDDDVARAGVALKEAETRAAEGVVEPLKSHLARCRADVGMLRDINRIDGLRWSYAMARPGGPYASDEWPGAFARYGIVPGRAVMEEAARQINNSPIRDRLLIALDRWYRASRSESVLAILQAVDPDPYRMACRVAIARAGKSRGTAVELASRPEALTQPAWFAVFLGEWAPTSPARRREILLAVLQRRPGDFRVLMALGSQLPINNSQTAAEREQWYRAALAVRADTAQAWIGLGSALRDRADLAGAILCFREAVRMEPDAAYTHDWLAFSLLEGGDAKSALPHAERATALEPGYTQAWKNLGWARRELGDPAGVVAAYREVLRLNPNSADAIADLGVAHLQADETAQAEALIPMLLAAGKQPDLHPLQFANPLSRLGEALVDSERFAAAEPLLRECLAIRGQFTAGAWWTAYTQSYLGEALARQAKYAEAEPLLIQAEENLAKVEITSGWQEKIRERLRVTVEQLVRLYEATGKSDQAKQWHAAMAKYPHIAPTPREMKKP